MPELYALLMLDWSSHLMKSKAVLEATNHNGHLAPALTEDVGISEILTHGAAKDIR